MYPSVPLHLCVCISVPKVLVSRFSTHTVDAVEAVIEAGVKGGGLSPWAHTSCFCRLLSFSFVPTQPLRTPATAPAACVGEAAGTTSSGGAFLRFDAWPAVSGRE